VKLNVVLTRDVNLSEMLDFVRLTENERLSVRFIEFMPFSGTFSLPAACLVEPGKS
jgi:cyclic pyranopterin phosphate synthase